MRSHDVIVIGASAGGLEVLLDLVPELPATFPASLFVVVHTPPSGVSSLPELLSSRGRLPAVHPLHGDAIAPGRIYVAPPDMHLLVRQGSVAVVRGPLENGHRPAVDALFRTASWSYGPRVVAVVLSGHQDCGTTGMMSVKARGGVAVVQDPATAAVPEMPVSVVKRVEVDHVVHPLELPGLLVRLAAEPAADVEPAAPTPDLEAMEVREQDEEVERALWAAVRALEESAGLSRRMAAHQPDAALRRRFVEIGGTQARQADLLRRVLLEGGAAADAEEREGAREAGVAGEAPSAP